MPPVPGPHSHHPWRKELLDTTKLEELSITNASSSSSPPQPPPCEDTDQAVNHDTIKVSEKDKSPPSLLGGSPSSQNTPPIYSLKPRGLNFNYYVRVDIGGSFHTYPALTGPFQSLKAARDAINSNHAEQCKMMCMKGLSKMEIGIRRALYWPNGLRKNTAEAWNFIKNLHPEVELVRALLDKYNEDKKNSGDPVYELIKVEGCEPIHERNGSSNGLYYHFNLVIRTKGADDSHGCTNNLYFAEVAQTDGKFEESVLTFFRMLKPDDNGNCIGCSVHMKHPNDVEYKRGRPRILLPGLSHDEGSPDEGASAYMEQFVAVYDEAELKAQEARVRNEFKEVYDRGLARVQKKYVVPAKRQVV